MYVCLCNGITETQIKQAVCEGACCVNCLKSCLGVATQCGKCTSFAEQIIIEQLASVQTQPPGAVAA